MITLFILCEKHANLKNRTYKEPLLIVWTVIFLDLLYLIWDICGAEIQGVVVVGLINSREKLSKFSRERHDLASVCEEGNY